MKRINTDSDGRTKLTDARLTVDIPTCAKLLGIGRGTAYALAAEGKLPAIRLGRRLVVPIIALEKMLAEAASDAPKSRTTGMEHER